MPRERVSFRTRDGFQWRWVMLTERIQAADEKVAFLLVELRSAGIRTPRPADRDFLDVL